MGARIVGRLYGKVDGLSRDEYYSDKVPEANIEVRPGMTFEYLQYRGEGSCFVRIEYDVIETGCPADKSLFDVQTKPKTELWIHVALPDGSAGWILVDGTNVKEVDRVYLTGS